MATSDPRELELTPGEFRRMVNAAAERIEEYIERLPREASADLDGADGAARKLSESDPPTGGTSFESLLEVLFEEAIPKSLNAAGPGYLAYIPGGGLLHSAVADLVAASVNRYVGIWGAAPALVRLEADVVGWFCRMVGYPDGARGVLTSGGSLANLSAVVTARSEKLPEDFLDGVLYASDQVHHSVTKAASLAGFPRASVRSVATDSRFRIRLDALEDALREDREAGRRPFLVVGSAGTVNTGAVDDLEGLAELCRAHDLWFHVDAAYGGFFVLTERGRSALRGLEAADSITLDPHKGLFVPYGTGSLLVRDGSALERAHRVGSEYIPDVDGDELVVDFSHLSPELSRPFRGLRVWIPLKMHGVQAFEAALDEKLDLVRWATGELRKVEGLEIVAEPQLSITAFRLRPPDRSGEELDRLNRRFLEAVNARQRVHLSGTTVRGRFTLRICVLSYRTDPERMRMAVDDIRSAAREAMR